ncbi:MAG: hypothetical protein HY446_00870 [Candidatus Niyogibacteria bacterium]|nr:hypothetical protein [Candidatus Niyogibacteria bacterium]
MDRKGLIPLFAGLAVLALVSFLQINDSPQAFAGAEHNLSGWAWSENIGWISFNSAEGGGSNYGVSVASNGRLSGYAWSENIGWITFNQNDLNGCPSGQCRAEFDEDTGQVTGWARALSNGGGWDGWISLSGSNYGVSVNQCSWSGWAWGSDVVGWISFNSADYGSGASYSVSGSGDACTLFSGNLSASPSSGYAPLATTLSAGVSGGSGTINYTFWWNCTNSSDSVSVATSACGDPTNSSIGAKFDGISETSKNADHVYSSVGSYTAKVIIERGSRRDEVRIAVDVQTPPADFSLTSSGNIETLITSAPLATSTEAVISVAPLYGFNSQVTLSVESVSPDLPGAIYHFRRNSNGQEASSPLSPSPTMTLNSSQFSSGADFWVRIPRETALQEYVIRLKGEGDGKTRYVDVRLNATIVSPDFIEI